MSSLLDLRVFGILWSVELGQLQGLNLGTKTPEAPQRVKEGKGRLLTRQTWE